MHKIDGPGHVGGQFVSEDAATGRAPTVVTPEWLNAVQGELVAVIEAGGLVPSKSNSAQLLGALQSGLIQAPAPIFLLDQSVVGNSTGVMPVLAEPLAGQGGKVMITAGTFFALGMEIEIGISAIHRKCVSVAWVSPTLAVNSEYYLRAQFVADVLTFYVQKGTLTDAAPSTQKGTANGASGGGFYSTPLDICLARIVTGAAGSVPSVQNVINRRSLSWSATLNGSGTVYLPIDPFTKTGRITASDITPHASLISQITHGSGGWTGYAYWNATPTGSGGYIPTHQSSANWAAGGTIIIMSNNVVSDATVTTCTGMFEHISGKSMWQVVQMEHQIGDTGGTNGDEHLLGMGTKNMLRADYDSGLAISYSNCMNALLTWEIVR